MRTPRESRPRRDHLSPHRDHPSPPHDHPVPTPTPPRPRPVPRPAPATSCIVCGSSEDTHDAILLCDTPGCDSAAHLSCLRTPLAHVPEGDWHCELCAEDAAAPAAAAPVDDDEASPRWFRRVLPDCISRWRHRLSDVTNTTQLALAIGALEKSLRLDDVAAAAALARKGQRGGAASADAVSDRRLALAGGGGGGGGGGFYEYLLRVVSEAPPTVCQIIIPNDVKEGQLIKCNWAGGAFKVRVPPGAAAGTKINVKVGHETAPATSAWTPLPRLATPILICKVLEFECRLEIEARRDLHERLEVQQVINLMIIALALALGPTLIPTPHPPR